MGSAVDNAVCGLRAGVTHFRPKNAINHARELQGCVAHLKHLLRSAELWVPRVRLCLIPWRGRIREWLGRRQTCRLSRRQSVNTSNDEPTRDLNLDWPRLFFEVINKIQRTTHNTLTTTYKVGMLSMVKGTEDLHPLHLYFNQTIWP